MRYRLVHQSRYAYSEHVTLCHNELRMTPRDGDGQRCISSVVTIEPEQNTYDERTDFFGNCVVYFDIESPHDALDITVSSEIETDDRTIDEAMVGYQSWEQARDALYESVAPDVLDAKLYQLESPLVPAITGLEGLTDECFPPGRSLLDASMALMAKLYRDWRYDPTATTIATPLRRVLESRAGVCQDFAHLGVAVLRHLGLAACYVSGYLETLPPPGKAKLRGADASHAWFSVFFPGVGWIDFDPTNDQRPNARYVIVARGRDYGDVSPMRGIVFGGGHMTLSVSVDVEPLT